MSETTSDSEQVTVTTSKRALDLVLERANIEIGELYETNRDDSIAGTAREAHERVSEDLEAALNTDHRNSTIPSTDRPTNFSDIRESVALALQEEAPEAKTDVLATLDDAIANNAHHLHFPSDDPVGKPYSALIIYEGGSAVDDDIVSHYYDGQTLVVNYENGTESRYPFGSVETVTNNQNC